VSLRRGLVLGGGGVLGAAWMIGALGALEEAYGWDTRTADVLVGTSAGAVLAALLGRDVRVGTLVNYQRGTPAPDDPQVGYDVDSSSGGALPPRPKLGIGSRALLARTAVRPRRYPPLAALAALAPHGRASLAPIGELIEAAAPGTAWTTDTAVWIITMDYDRGRRVAFGRSGAPAARMPEAVMASCAIPGWYAPVQIGGRSYVDGGVCSPTSLDLVAGGGLDEVVVLAPMASFDYDSPASVVGRLERRFRRAMTRRVLREADKVRRAGTTVTILAPGAEDLTAIGVNLMDPSRRQAVFETSSRTSARVLSRGATRLAG